jgi:hypothetical protein
MIVTPYRLLTARPMLVAAAQHQVKLGYTLSMGTSILNKKITIIMNYVIRDFAL